MRPPTDDPDTHLRLGLGEYQAGRLPEAATAFERARDLAPPDARGAAAFALGLVKIQQGDRQAAFTAWRQALATDDPEYAPRAALFIAVWLMADLP
jgi:tetratricopeptide (TPR) repeat protein